ncbi:hypothetical protein ACFORL_06580 [Legionella dresdenensis]|uniref:Uncharacterized protein n=1 Tax=Legionella dresdenensis TaxID=450200 RepID=A0ABV8CEZ5_9GAMM
MKQIWLSLVLFSSLLAGVGHAETVDPQDNAEIPPLQNMPSLQAEQANWVFSGMVSNENNEKYHYYFQINHNGNQYHGIAALFDSQNKAVLLYEESNTLIENPEQTHWQVGNLFLRFNPINNSWVFGVKNKGQKGFNFKVDMLGLAGNPPKQLDLRNGVELLISQTGRLNGHFQAGDGGKEQFVTAKKAWFKQIWVSKPQQAKHPLTAVLCEFNDGSAFYSVNLEEADALRGAIAGWRDTNGTPVSMSQFVNIKAEQDGIWQIKIHSPKVTLSLQDALDKINDNHQLIAGTISGAMPGFCAISQSEIYPPISQAEEKSTALA